MAEHRYLQFFFLPLCACHENSSRQFEWQPTPYSWVSSQSAGYALIPSEDKPDLKPTYYWIGYGGAVGIFLEISARLIADLLAQPPLPTEFPEPLSSSPESDPPLLRVLISCLPATPQQFEAFFFTACLPQLSLLLLHEFEHSSSLRWALRGHYSSIIPSWQIKGLFLCGPGESIWVKGCLKGFSRV